MEIHNISIKTVLEGKEENLFLHRDNELIREDYLTDEEIHLLENIVQRHKDNKNKKSIINCEMSRSFVLKSELEGKEVSNILMGEDINSSIEDNRLFVWGIRNSKIAAARITEYRSRKDALSK
ncbi:hypothetical protein [Priestia aryabhattai]